MALRKLLLAAFGAAFVASSPTHAATFTVDTTADFADASPGDGVCLTAAATCTLRAAIEEANATLDSDTIAFAVPGPGVHVIQTATLPAITQPAVVDGFTQPGAQPNTNATGALNTVLRIELTGGLVLRGGHVLVRGVAVNEGTLLFEEGPVVGPEVVEGCYVGTDATGAVDRSTGIGIEFSLTGGAIRVGGAAPGERNLVSGNTIGVYLSAATCGEGSCVPGALIQGNLIGTDASGAASLPNGIGIRLFDSGGTIIGGLTAAEGNVISGNASSGIVVWAGTWSWRPTAVVQGNRIGVDATGANPIPNGTGIYSGPPCWGHPSCFGAPALEVGGSPAAANVIARNLSDGIHVGGGEVSITHNAIEANGLAGLFFSLVNHAEATGEIAENVIRGNGGDGIESPYHRFAGTIRGNTITANAGRGVGLGPSTLGLQSRSRIVTNSIYANGQIGIDLGRDGVTANDVLDQDAGPNDYMNFPVITRACSVGGVVTVEGSLHTRPGSTAVVEVFRNAACDPSGHGPGEVPKATAPVSVDAGGNGSFVASFPGGNGDFIAATATSAAGETSEFGACVPITPTAPPTPVIGGPAAVCTGSPFVLAVTPGATSDQWFLDGLPIAGATAHTYGRESAAAGDAGTYTVRASSCGMDVTSSPFAFAVVSCAALPVSLGVDRHASAGTSSDLNGVLEPGETALVEPHYLNSTASSLTLSASATVGGPAGAVYALPDAAADYGTVAPSQVTDCFAATGDCYRATVLQPGPRPLTHWDAAFTETTSGGDPARHWPLHVGETFSDVPRANIFYRFVETLVHNGVTGGCSGATYCPQGQTTREQMAVFVLVAKESALYRPPDCDPSAPRFSDVPPTSPFCRWVEELARRGVVAGCGGGNFCPAFAVPREQMAVFVLAAHEAPGYQPPACMAGSEMFADVPAASPFCRWIEELARRGVVAGCGGGNYCPTSAVTRGEMAVFITATFGLLLYGP